MTNQLKNATTGLMLLLTLGVLLAPPALAAPAVTQNLTYGVSQDGQSVDCSSACSYSVQQKIIKTKFYPCPPGQVGGYYEVTVTVQATVYINGNPYPIYISRTLYKTGACVAGVSGGCDQSQPTWATDEFGFANNVKTASASGLLITPDSATTPSFGQFTLTGYDSRGAALGSWTFTCMPVAA